ncbi:MAG TPA: hypothetical protein VFH12_03945, partial [Pseudoxanthomonas sp.]|nr:hypothetical protein [Pseudoxanthomonas sp.]
FRFDGKPLAEAFLPTKAWAREGECSRLHTGIQQYRTRGPSGPFVVSGPSLSLFTILFNCRRIITT